MKKTYRIKETRWVYVDAESEQEAMGKWHGVCKCSQPLKAQACCRPLAEHVEFISIQEDTEPLTD
jgi:uncharacterized protein YchJ